MSTSNISLGGLPIETSKRGSTGLNGVSYSPAFVQGRSSGKPFIAFTNREKAERLSRYLDRTSYPYGGEAFHIGGFDTPGQAAYARAYFLKNTNQLVDWWQRNGGPDLRVKTFATYPWEFPDLSAVDNNEEILRGIRAATQAYKNGASVSVANQAAEKARAQAEKNLSHIAQAQQRNTEEDSTAAVIASSPTLQNTIRRLKNKGANQADLVDDISAYLKQGVSPEKIATQLESDYLEEQQQHAEESALFEDIKRLATYLKNR